MKALLMLLIFLGTLFAKELILEDFSNPKRWTLATTNAVADWKIENQQLTVAVPFVEGKRTIFGLVRNDFQLDLTKSPKLNFKVFIPLRSSLTIETVLEGKIVRLLNYRVGKGIWEVITLEPKGSIMKTLILHFGQANAETSSTEVRTSIVSSIWVEGSQVETLAPVSGPVNDTGYFKTPVAITSKPYVDGDRVATIGDSITHNGTYHAFVVDFYLTRYPQAKVLFFNRGISGDTAGGVLSRWDWDVMTKEFNKATLMLGMNDVNRSLYATQTPDEANLKTRQEAFDTWKNNMTEIRKRLSEKSVTFSLIMPSIYDQTSQQTNTKNFLGVNDVLSNCAELNKNLATENGWGLINFQTPLYNLNVEVQKTNPMGTIIGNDRIHPGDLGHSIMALLYLKSQGVQTAVANVSVDAKTKTILKVENATVQNVETTGAEVTFSLLANSLPIPVSPGYLAADPLVGLTPELNTELFSIANLEPGEWTLTIDTNNLGTFTATQLSAGINIATNWQNPDQLQAQAIHSTNWTRRAIEAQTRNIVMVEMSLARAKIDVNDAEAVKTYCETQVANNKKPGGNGFLASLFSGYLTLKPKQAELHAQVENLWQVLWAMNKPVKHQVVLKKV